MNNSQCPCSPLPILSIESFTLPDKQVGWLIRLWQQWMRLLNSRQEPKVWQAVDCQGQIVAWHVFDPLSGATNCFGSKQEVRLWLEQQYSR